MMYLGIHVGLRFSDLRVLKWGDIFNPNGIIILTEKKTGKDRKIVLKDEVKAWLYDIFKIRKATSNDYIIVNRKLKPISISYANRILKEIEEEYGFADKLSTHSLRKTFGRRVYDLNPSEQRLLLLSDIFNHANIRDTRRYLGLREEEINEIYLSL